MKKKALQKRILFLLVIVTILIAIGYFLTLGEKYRLRSDLITVKKRAVLLEREKQRLLRQLAKEKAIQEQLNMQAAALGEPVKQILISERTEAIDTTEKDAHYLEAQKIIEELNLRLAALKDENDTLKEHETQLQAQVTNLAQENSILKYRLTSIPELKKAIKEAKVRMQQMGVSLRRKTIDKILDGNRGYLVKDGKSNASGKVKIEVKPFSPGQ